MNPLEAPGVASFAWGGVLYTLQVTRVEAQHETSPIRSLASLTPERVLGTTTFHLSGYMIEAQSIPCIEEIAADKARDNLLALHARYRPVPS